MAGLDVGGGVYTGTYVEKNGHRVGTAVLSMPSGGHLVNGLQVPAGTTIPIEFAIPVKEPNGHTLTASAAGRYVSAILHSGLYAGPNCSDEPCCFATPCKAEMPDSQPIYARHR